MVAAEKGAGEGLVAVGEGEPDRPGLELARGWRGLALGEEHIHGARDVRGEALGGGGDVEALLLQRLLAGDLQQLQGPLLLVGVAPLQLGEPGREERVVVPTLGAGSVEGPLRHEVSGRDVLGRLLHELQTRAPLVGGGGVEARAHAQPQVGIGVGDDRARLDGLPLGLLRAD